MDQSQFGELFEAVEPGLRRALISWYGPSVGRDAAASAWSWAWENRDRLASIDNVGGYLFRVGQSAAKRDRSRGDAEVLAELSDDGIGDVPSFEPALAPALLALTDRQRAGVLMVHGYGYTYREAADLLNVSLATLRTHVERAMQKLRTDLEAHDDARTG